MGNIFGTMGGIHCIGVTHLSTDQQRGAKSGLSYGVSLTIMFRLIHIQMPKIFTGFAIPCFEISTSSKWLQDDWHYIVVHVYDKQYILPDFFGTQIILAHVPQKFIQKLLNCV